MAEQFWLNGKPCPVPDEPQKRLVALLRDDHALSSAREGCGIGRCGSCIVLLDDRAVNACLVMAAQLPGKHVTTAEGLGAEADPIRAALAASGAVQCGYCTPGILVSLYAALQEGKNAAQAEEDMIGNICRCTGYGGLRRAIAALLSV